METETKSTEVWRCEWCYPAADEIVTQSPEKCRVTYCDDCMTKTWHALVPADSPKRKPSSG